MKHKTTMHKEKTIWKSRVVLTSASSFEAHGINAVHLYFCNCIFFFKRDWDQPHSILVFRLSVYLDISLVSRDAFDAEKFLKIFPPCDPDPLHTDWKHGWPPFWSGWWGSLQPGIHIEKLCQHTTIYLRNESVMMMLVFHFLAFSS